MTRKTIVAMGGGGFMMEPDNLLLDQFLLDTTGEDKPSVCLVPTASGDSEGLLERFYAAMSTLQCEPTHLSLFRRDGQDLESFVLAQDLIYVGGGNTANMLAIWRLHGLDKILRKAWESGVVLAGLSAGSLCWFEMGVTDSFGPGLAPLRDGLGLLPGSHCPHYDGEALRRPRYLELVRSGVLAPGFAIDDGAALVFDGIVPVDAVSSRRAARAFEVTVQDAVAHERALDVRFLGTNLSQSRKK